jgi:calcium-translocating P-type ATPase
MTASVAAPQLSPCLAGDPVRLGSEITGLEDVARRLGWDAERPRRCLGLVPGVALLHSVADDSGPIALRWLNLPHAPPVVPGGERAHVVLVLTGPIVESGRILRLLARLVACLRDPTWVPAAAAATSREGLVRVLSAVESEAGESPLPGDTVLAVLGSTPAGLDDPEVARRLVACGPNRLERVRRRPLGWRLAEQFASFFALLLWVGGALALLAGLPELGWAIFAVILINGVFSFLQEFRAERAVEALQDLLPRDITAVRDGGEQRVAAADLVPGDVVRLEEGDQVPADGQLLSATGLRVDQSALTGESHPIFKLAETSNERERVPFAERHELVFAGTGAVAGSGTLVVRATGMRTQIGTIARLTQSVVEEASPLQREIARVTRIVTVLAASFGLSFFVLGVASRAVSVSDGFLFALGVIVANVPEGLLPTLTLALAMGVQRMARAGSVMKRLSSVETLGATTVICTDKTGTLTQNRMTARAVWASGQQWPETALGPQAPAAVRELVQAATLASQATADHGDPTEIALVQAAILVGLDPETLRAAEPLVAPYPFDSFRKRMTLVRARDSAAVGYVKGAPRETLALCTGLRADGVTVPLTEERRAAIVADHDRLAVEGLRILAVATRALPPALVGAPAMVVERDLTLLGLVALWDPPRPEVADAVAQCARAGIRVVMVTGDYGLTASAIARQVGLPATKVVTGEEIDQLSPEALRGLAVERGVLFARTSPAHKLALVNAFKAHGDIVAVTGDGVNDAPALKAADIGVAMGGRGSDVAREAAVMVITDDNFASIVTAIRQGRAIYANMGKFVTYIFASNVPELVPFLAFVFLGIPLPLTVMQMLAVDLGTDLLPALALGAEPPEADVMDQAPRPRGERLLSAARLVRAYGFLGVAEAALSMLGFFWTYVVAGWRPGLPMAASGDLYRRATTMTLAGIVAAQVGNVFACRTDRESVLRVGLFRNRLVLGGIAVEVGLLLTLILVSPLRHAFGLAPLAVEEWGILLVFPIIMLALEEARKWLGRATRGATNWRSP